MVLIAQGTKGEEKVRAASTAEVELWNALTKRFASPSRESYIRVNEQDLVTVLMERDHLRRQVSVLEAKVKELQNDEQGQQREPHEAADERGSPGGESTP